MRILTIVIPALVLTLAPSSFPVDAATPVLAAPSTVVVRDGGWSWPTDAPRRVIRPFIAPPVKWGSGHRGVDLAAGDTLLAPAAGVVSFAGRVVDRGVLSIDHGGGVVSSYEPVIPTVAAGDPILTGEPIAVIEPGHCTAPCVHMGVRVDGEYANPLRWLGGVPRSVLLPTRALD